MKKIMNFKEEEIQNWIDQSVSDHMCTDFLDNKMNDECGGDHDTLSAKLSDYDDPIHREWVKYEEKYRTNNADQLRKEAIEHLTRCELIN